MTTWRFRWQWPLNRRQGDLTLLLGLSVWRRAHGCWTIDLALLLGWLTIETGHFSHQDTSA